MRDNSYSLNAFVKETAMDLLAQQEKDSPLITSITRKKNECKFVDKKTFFNTVIKKLLRKILNCLFY